MFADSVHQHANTDRAARANQLEQQYLWNVSTILNVATFVRYPCTHAGMLCCGSYLSLYVLPILAARKLSLCVRFACVGTKSTMICGGKYLRITAYFECRSSAPHQGWGTNIFCYHRFNYFVIGGCLVLSN